MAARIDVTFLMYLLARSFDVMEYLLPRNVLWLRQNRALMGQLLVASNLVTIGALVKFAIACWSLSAAFRRTADDAVPADSAALHGPDPSVTP